MLTGEVTRAIRSIADEPQGLIKEKIQDLFTGRQFKFSASSFCSKPIPVLQVGDSVEFKIGTVIKTGEQRAAEIRVNRSRLRSKVTTVKGEVSTYKSVLSLSDQKDGNFANFWTMYAGWLKNVDWWLSGESCQFRFVRKFELDPLPFLAFFCFFSGNLRMWALPLQQFASIEWRKVILVLRFLYPYASNLTFTTCSLLHVLLCGPIKNRGNIKGGEGWLKVAKT